MPALTRRRDPAAHDETWLIHYDDVHVGTIRMRTGVPTNVDGAPIKIRLPPQP